LIRTRFWFPVLIALLCSVPAVAGNGPAVVYPPDLTLVTGKTVDIFAFRGKGEDPVPVSVNGLEKDPLEGENLLSGSVDLYFGKNVIDVGGTRVRVYSLPGTKLERYKTAPGPDGSPPLSYLSYRLHPALEDGCEGCHTVKDGKLATMLLKDACYSCHDNFEEGGEEGKWFVHGPVASGECTECHDPHFSIRLKLLKKDNICAECHDPFLEEGTVHIPVKYGECTACHSPHAGPAPKQLRRAGNALCLGCHENPHAQHRSAEVKGSITTIPEDFPKEKGQLSCLGCHRPHQSSERRLFRMKQGEMCQTCHRV